MEKIKFKHTQKIKSCDLDNKQLAVEIGDLYYDNLSDFLQELSKKLHQDSIADGDRGRKKLSNSLENASKYILEASKEIDTAWDICKPYVKKWIKQNESNRDD